ncbi:MAG: efflux RND transporter permease subunit [Thermoanaerobaculia bacterium]|nr:efflux RND transporter permease subunit [Thermoanaerobaculia bacterium]
MIWNFCIRRPVLTVVVFLVVAIFGLYGYQQMPVREIPDIDFPIVSVNVVLPGAEPEVIETEILEPLEEEINTIEGLKELTSTAREQVGTVTAEFKLWRDIDIATQDVRDRVERARRDLPQDIEAPIVSKLDPDAQAIMWLALTGDERWDQVRMTEYADKILKERLENIRGVGRIQVGGSRLYAVRVRLDADELAGYGLTVQDVVGTIRANNVDIPSGRVESESREFLVKTQGQFASPGPMNDLIVAVRNGNPVRIRDVGEVVPGVENDRLIARFTGEPAVGLGIVKQADANTVALAETVKRRMEDLSRQFPPGLSYDVAADDSTYIAESIEDLLLTIGLATLLVVAVVLAFLRTAWGTLITSLAIPTSLLGGTALMHLMGFSINTLTMLGLILVIGIVVDDAIVILESCYRKQEHGMEPRPAAQAGTTEVAFAAIANSLALGAVFIPVAFTQGLIGRFFQEFGLTVASTVFASTFTALTLTPMLCARFLRVPERHGRLFQTTERHWRALEGFYTRVMDRAFAHRGITVVAAIVTFGLAVLFFVGLSTEFVPSVDRSEFLISFETPEGSTLQATDRYARQIESVLDGIPEIDHYFQAIGLSGGGGPGEVNQGIVFTHLIPRSERDRHQVEVMQEVRERLRRLPAGQAFVIETSIAGPSEAPLQVVLQSPRLDELDERQREIMSWMRSQPSFVGINSDLKMNKPQVEIGIDREKASEMGISVADIANTLRFLLGEPEVSEIESQSERYEVIPELIGQGELVPDILKDFYVRGSGGQLVSLGNLATIEETIGPSEIHHFNRLRAATVSSSTPPGVALGDAVAELETRLEEILPPGFDYALTGEAQDFQESFYYLTLALVFSVVFIYLVLAAQFESWLHPLTILVALPLAGVGAFGGLWVLGMTFNIYSFIGLIMLMGMATKNAILLIDYTNVLRRRGYGLIEAAKEAAHVRLRPVLMTTFSTVLGMMPIALGFGAGGEARAPLGVAVAAGLLATTFLTLVVIPVVYTLFDALQQKLFGTAGRQAETRVRRGPEGSPAS